MNLLEERLAAIEKMVGEGDANICDSLFQSVLQMKELLKGSNNNHISYKVQKLTQAIMNFDTNYSGEALSQENKIIIIQKYEEELSQAQENLDIILKLKKFIDFEPVVQLKEKISQIIMLHTNSDISFQNGEQQVHSSNATMLLDEFNRQQKDLENIVKCNYELNQILKSNS